MPNVKIDHRADVRPLPESSTPAPYAALEIRRRRCDPDVTPMGSPMKDVKFSWGCIGAGSAILLFIAALANNVRHDTNMAGAADAVENNCLATTDHTCASRTNLAANKSCLVCVYQPCDRFRLKACAPIEPLKLKEWRHDARNGDHHHDLTGDATDLRTGAVNDLVVLKASWATEAVAAKRRIYVDLGANLYESSIGNWFRASYPDAGTYKVYAFEAEHKYDDSYAGHPDVTLLHYAVSTANGTIPWGHMVKKGGRTRSGFALGPGGRRRLGSGHMAKKGGRTRSGFALGGGGRRLGSSHNLVQDGTRPAIDIADWLRRTVRPDDFVVVKMDIEGAEYDVVPHLLREKVADLIDELFLEIHTETNTCCKPPHDVGRHRPDAMRLLQSLRDAGVYAHEWL